MSRENRTKYLENIRSVLRKYHISSIESLFEGSFERGNVQSAEIVFSTPDKHGFVEHALNYVHNQISMEGFSCNINMAFCEYKPHKKRYKFKIEPRKGRECSLAEYEYQTEAILQKVPRLIRDFGQKNPIRL